MLKLSQCPLCHYGFLQSHSCRIKYNEAQKQAESTKVFEKPILLEYRDYKKTISREIKFCLICGKQMNPYNLSYCSKRCNGISQRKKVDNR